ncbi:hypothetical protein Emag_005842 [Eimeria magna]
MKKLRLDRESSDLTRAKATSGGDSRKSPSGAKKVSRYSISGHQDESSAWSSRSEEAFGAPMASPSRKKRSRQTPRAQIAVPTIAAACEDAGMQYNKETPPPTSVSDSDTLVHQCVGVLDFSQSINDFGALHLDRRLVKVLTDVLRLEHPTHVQAQASLQTTLIAIALAAVSEEKLSQCIYYSGVI